MNINLVHLKQSFGTLETLLLKNFMSLFICKVFLSLKLISDNLFPLLSPTVFILTRSVSRFSMFCHQGPRTVTDIFPIIRPPQKLGFKPLCSRNNLGQVENYQEYPQTSRHINIIFGSANLWTHFTFVELTISFSMQLGFSELHDLRVIAVIYLLWTQTNKQETKL